MKLLIDECLSEELTKRARERGHVGSSHVRWIGKGGAKDWTLMAVILDGDWAFVTCNSIDFRGTAEAPGEKGEYRKAQIHAGLVCLNTVTGMDLDMQLELSITRWTHSTRMAIWSTRCSIDARQCRRRRDRHPPLRIAGIASCT